VYDVPSHPNPSSGSALRLTAVPFKSSTVDRQSRRGLDDVARQGDDAGLHDHSRSMSAGSQGGLPGDETQRKLVRHMMFAERRSGASGNRRVI
jgi:hypothetical protein